MQQEQLTINKLKSIHDNASNNPEIFGLRLYDFIKEYDLNSILQPMIKSIQDNESNDKILLNELSEKALLEMELAYYGFRDYESKKLRMGSQFFNIYDFELYRNKSMSIINDPIIARHNILRNFVWSLAEDDSADAKLLLQQCAILDDEGRIQECIFAPSVYLWLDEKKAIENLQPLRIWYSFNILIGFFFNYKQGPNLAPKAKDIEELRYHMQRLLNYTIGFLAQKQSGVSDKQANYDISYNHDSGQLTINGSTTKFITSSNSHIILTMLIPKEGRLKSKTFGYETISTKIKKHKNYDPTKGEPDIYEICRSINKHIANKLSLSEFILDKESTVKINPKYLC